MQTLSKGYKKPESGDKGSTFFPALEDNISRLNSHSHNGTNSEALSPTAVVPNEQTLESSDWVAVVGVAGLYKQTVTIPNSMTFYQVLASFYIDDELTMLEMEKLSDTTFDVYCNDNSKDVKVIYK